MNQDLIIRDKNGLTEFLESYEKNIMSVIGDGVQFGRIMSLAVMALKATPALGNCTKDSFLKSLIESLIIGIEPNTPLDQAYLIPFKGKVTLQLGYKGLIRLAYNSGRIDSLYPVNVFEGDDFQVTRGTSPEILHTENYDCERSDKTFKFSYACVRMKDSTVPIFDVMTKKEVDLIRAKAQTQKIWTPHYLEMAKKSVIKRITKIIPQSSESIYLAQAVQLDNQAETGKDQTFMADTDELCELCGTYHRKGDECPLP